jgi:hypothetical protein
MRATTPGCPYTSCIDVSMYSTSFATDEFNVHIECDVGHRMAQRRNPLYSIAMTTLFFIALHTETRNIQSNGTPLAHHAIISA